MERICRVRLAALQTRALRSKHGDCKTVIEVKKEKAKENRTAYRAVRIQNNPFDPGVGRVLESSQCI